jgi:serine/threonine-protein kinase
MPSLDSSTRGKGCPGREALAAYAAGKLPSAVLEVVARHVAACPLCQCSLEQVPTDPVDDSLIEQLRRCVLAGPNLPVAGSTEETTAPEPEAVPGPGAGSTLATGGPQAAFGQYELLEELGHGGMGVVYKARQTRLHRLVAIKMIRTGAYAAPAERVRFRVEGEAVARLQHPHVVQVHEFNEHDGQLYLCMEYLAGGSLAGKLTGSGLPLREAARLIETLADAVEAAHRRHIVHRDLKPSNVLLTEEGTPKIGDFGLAKLLDAEGGETAPDAVLGTPSYMAPEQAEGRAKEVGTAADVYALGAILYETLTGRPPFKAATRVQTLNQVRAAEPVPPRHLRREVPPDLEAVCLRCLAKRPEQRYASAEALGRDLGRWLRGEPTAARPLPWYARAWRRAPHRALAAALLLVVGLVAVLPFLRRSPEDPDRPVKEIEEQLARHNPVTLIGETGEPAWSRFETGADASQTSRAADDAFTLSTWGRAMLVLVRDPQVERYQFHADVRHEKGGDLGEVGLVIGLTAYPAGDDVLYFFVRAAFDDIKDVTKSLGERPAGVKLPPPPKANPVRLGARLYTDRKPRPLWDEEIQGVAPELFQAAGASGGPWRTLKLDVTPQSIRATWGKKDVVGELPAVDLETNTLEALNRMQGRKAQGPPLRGISPRFNPRAPLGLYVNKGSASFRRVMIEPIVENGQTP